MRQGRRRSSIEQPTETCTCFKLSDRVKAIKNLLGVCISFICSFGAFIGQLYLQSSLNVDSGLGLISSSLVYGAQVMLLFLCPAINCLLGSKYSILLGYLLLIPYTLANYYPRSYTLYPASILAGMSLALLFVNTQVHNSTIANKYAHALNEKSENAIVLYASVFSMAIKLAQVLGSLISSVTLVNFSTSNDSIVEEMSNETCSNADASSITEQEDLYYILVSIYLFLGVVGLIVSITTIDHLGTEAKYLTAPTIAKKYVFDSTFKILKLLVHWKMFLLFPMLVVNGISIAFIIGTFSKVCVCACTLYCNLPFFM